jgi:hypothetical protein
VSPPVAPPPPAWTIDQACDYFAAAGLPIPGGPRRLAAIIGRRALAWQPVGETPSGERGGRGKALYPARDFQLLHRDLADWLARIPDPGEGASSDPRE